MQASLGVGYYPPVVGDIAGWDFSELVIEQTVTPCAKGNLEPREGTQDQMLQVELSFDG